MNFLRSLYILVIVILISNNAIAQSDSLNKKTSSEIRVVFDPANKPPEFKEGNYNSFIAKNLSYPQDAIKAKIQGKVYVRFTVELDGAITDIRVVKGLFPSLDAEALRLTELTSGKWKPGTLKEIPTRSYKQIVIDFYLKK